MATTTEKGTIKPLKRKIDFSKLPPLESAADIAEMNITPLQHIVDGIITEGVGLLAAREKSGKSWFCYQLGQCVAEGKPFLGHPVTKGTCIYFDFENERPVRQQRIKVMFPDGKPKDLLFVNPNQQEDEEPEEVEQANAKKPDPEEPEDIEPILIGDGFEEVLNYYLDQRNDTKLVIIDVLDIIADDQRKNEAPKKHAYRNISRLKRIARKRHIAIICVMHFRKYVDPDDFMANISGSNGWSAAADYAMGITRKRGEANAVFQTDGRTCRGVEMSITQDEQTMRWKQLGSLEEMLAQKRIDDFKKHDVTRTIVAVVKANNGKWAGTSDALKGCTLFETDENGEEFPKIALSAKAVTAFIRGNLDLFKSEYGISIHDKNQNNNKTSEWVMSK